MVQLVYCSFKVKLEGLPTNLLGLSELIEAHVAVRQYLVTVGVAIAIDAVLN